MNSSSTDMNRRQAPWPRLARATKAGCAAAVLLSGMTCGANPNSPGGVGQTVTTYFANSTASDGTSATVKTGSAPAPSGGPSITVTAPNTVVSGGTQVVRITSVTPFQQVFASVEGVDGFLQFSLKSSTTDITIVTMLGAGLPAGSFTVDYQAALSGGAVGAVAKAATTGLASSAPSANVAGTWAFEGTPVFTLSQSGSGVTGNEIYPTLPAGLSATGTVSATVSGNTVSGTNTQTVKTTDGTNISCTETDGFVMTVSGSTMTGTYTTGTLTCNLPGVSQPGGVPFSVTLTKQ